MIRCFPFYIFIGFVSCTHSVHRSGYNFITDHQKTTPLVIKKNVPFDSLINVGEISLLDGWWVVKCNEKEALSVIKKEAHLLKADVVHIKKEWRPDIESSCYRCEATFYQCRYPGMHLTQDSLYTDQAIQKRHKSDNKRKALLASGAVAIGFAIAIVIGVIYM